MACQYIGANPYLQMDLDIPCYQEEREGQDQEEHDDDDDEHGLCALQYQLTHRYLLSQEVHELLEVAGFEVAAFDGDFAGSTHQKDSESMVVRATKAKATDFAIYI